VAKVTLIGAGSTATVTDELLAAHGDLVPALGWT
jgi:hypothetical protein